jgi:regulator of protease activity HflC (stomatin/prohibitin superfamily)
MQRSTMYTAIGAIGAGGAVALGIMTWAFFMHTEVAEPGYEQVIVDKPYFFGHEGVRDETLKEGRILLFNTSTTVPVRMTPQSIPVKFDDFSSADNILLDFESTIQYRVTDPIKLISKFGVDWFENNLLRQYTAIVREAIKKKTMTEMMSDRTAAVDVDNEVTTALVALVKEATLPIEVIGVSMGRAKPNDNVLAQINETAAQQQRQKTLVAATLAEGEREKEQVAKAKADNAYRNAMSLSPDMFIQLEKIKRYADACHKAGTICIIDAGTGKAPPVLINPK